MGQFEILRSFKIFQQNEQNKIKQYLGLNKFILFSALNFTPLQKTKIILISVQRNNHQAFI